MNDPPDSSLDLLAELLIICDGAGCDIHDALHRLRAIRQKLISPDIPREAHGMGHRVYEVHKSGDETLCALASNSDVARAAFDRLVEKFPQREWVFRWGMMKPAHYKPPERFTRDPVPPRAID